MSARARILSLVRRMGDGWVMREGGNGSCHVLNVHRSDWTNPRKPATLFVASGDSWEAVEELLIARGVLTRHTQGGAS